MWRFGAILVISGVFVWVLNHPLKIGSTQLPALGKFLSPSEGFWQNAKADHDAFLAVESSHLKGEVNVVFDDRAVPHIFAEHNEDLYFAQGFVTARDRLWQMDIASRSSAGRISEILGPNLLDYDKMQRNLGFTSAAERTLERWEEDSTAIRIYRAYANGISAYIKTLKPREYPLEFKLLGYAPEEWNTFKCALFLKSMAWTLCGHNYDLEFTNLKNWLGPEQFAHLFPEYNPKQDPIIPPGTDWAFDPVSFDATPPVESYGIRNGKRPWERMDDLDPGNEIGSNNWALAGSRTASGKPLLCNDPHLKLSLPSIWYEIHLNDNTQNCRGVSFPGMPGIMIGFSQRIAWGATNVGHDVLDWYEIDWVDEEQTRYRVNGEVLEVDLRIEDFSPRDGDLVQDTVKYTIWGPVIKSGAYEGLAMRWLAHDKPDGLDGTVFININKSQNLEDFLAALDEYHTPSQNFVYADVDGNIALRIGGAFPYRVTGAGRLIADGSSGLSTIAGRIPPGHNPVTINPERGFVSSANQKTTDAAYPYYYTGGHYFEDYRGRTLNNLLTDLNDATVSDMYDLQHNNYSLKAEEMLPILLATLDSVELDEEEAKVRTALESWDYNYELLAVEPTFFEIWTDAFDSLTWDEFAVMEDSMEIEYPESWRTTELALSEPDTGVFDIESTTDKVESLTDIGYMSFKLTVATISEYSPDDLRWGHYRTTNIQHLANIPGLNEQINAPGHGDALNATGRRNGPSWRMVVDLSEPVTGFVVYPGGQSGNPGSPQYDNMIDGWMNRQYAEVRCNTSPAEIESVSVVEFKPRNR